MSYSIRELRQLTAKLRADYVGPEESRTEEGFKQFFMYRLWDNFLDVGVIQSSTTVSFAVSCASKDGVKYIVIRKRTYNARNKRWTMERNCIAIPVSRPFYLGNGAVVVLDIFDEVLKVLTDAREIVKTFSIEDEGNSVHIKRRIYSEKVLQKVSRVVGKKPGIKAPLYRPIYRATLNEGRRINDRDVYTASLQPKENEDGTQARSKD